MSLLKRISWIPSVIVIVGLTVISSCKDDEKPKSGISFELDELEITESNGTLQSFHPLIISGATGTELEVKILLDRPLDQETVIYFTVGGTAKINSASQLGDFTIVGNSNYITLDAGDTEGTITLNIFEDTGFDIESETNPYETVILTLDKVVTGSAQIVEDSQNVFTLKIYEDDLLVFLDWAGRATSNVDMDLFIWLDDPETAAVDFDVVRQSVQDGNALEAINIPAGYPNASYGMSYTYYAGSSDNLVLDVEFVNFGGNLNGSPANLPFAATYSLVNINKYDEPDGVAPIIVQTMVKNGFNYTGLAQISVPNEGSRLKTYPTVPIDFGKLRINSIFNDKVPFKISGIK